MEAPTPVSALLHAGIINAGGLMLIRTAEVVQASPGSMAALVMLGGFTALFGAVVMLTQSAVKTALAWSTVAQMGFMLLQCGLGLWPLALLHIVAHSLYKAHAFLSAGGAVGAVAAVRRPGPVAVPGAAAVGRSFVLALLLYAAVAGAFVLIGGAKSPQALALGAMLIFGVAWLRRAWRTRRLRRSHGGPRSPPRGPQSRTSPFRIWPRCSGAMRSPARRTSARASGRSSHWP